MFDYVIVGAGLSGCVIARLLADNYDKKILILERRDCIAGNLYDEKDEVGILIQKYGPHIFHTNSDIVYDFINKYHKWTPFLLNCKVFMKGQYTPSPFNFTTIDQYYTIHDATTLKDALLTYYPNRETVTIVELMESSETLIKDYANFLFDSDYSLYTAKQWGISPSEIDISVLKRVPVRIGYVDRYFSDKYQCMPQGGFTSFISSILNHRNITIKTGIDGLDNFDICENTIDFKDLNVSEGCTLVYTGAIDELFNYCYGPLPYRSLEFKYNTYNKDKFQSAPVVVYPEDPEYTRITEYKQLPVQEIYGVTTVAVEYPRPFNLNSNFERYYPTPTTKSEELFLKYKEKANKMENLMLCGRLADFKYYNMDQAILRCIQLFQK